MVDNLRQLAYRYYPLAVSVPSGTLIAAPTSTPAGLPDAILDSIEIQIPPGHVGLTGIAVFYDGQQIFPWSNTATWLVADNYVNTFKVGMEVGSHLRVVTYNLDVSAHTFYLRFEVRDLPIVGASNIAPVSSGADTAPAPVTTIITPTTPLPGGSTVTTDTLNRVGLDPSDPVVAQLLSMIKTLQTSVDQVSSDLLKSADTISALQAKVTKLESAKPAAATGSATSTAPGADPAVVAQLATAAKDPTAPLPAVTYTPTGSLADPTTGRAVFTGPNGEGGLGAPAYAGQPSYQMPDGRTAYYYPNQYIQNGNRAALGLPPLPNG